MRMNALHECGRFFIFAANKTVNKYGKKQTEPSPLLQEGV